MSCPAPCSVRQRRSALMLHQMPDSFEKIEKKNVPELHLVAIFCEKKSETVTKHRVTWSKITLFRLAIPKMAGFWKKSGIFVFFGGFGAFRPPSSAKLFLGQPRYSALREKKSALFFSTTDGSKPPPNHFLSKSKLKKVDF